MKRNSIRFSHQVLGTVSALAFFASVATGQYAIDNNLQQGGGGVNQPGQVYNYGAGNDIVTGNVTGSNYFRGDVGYRAPGEFRGSAGSDSQFRFRADSYGTSGGGAYGNYGSGGAGGYGAGGYSQSNPVYRSSTGVSAGDLYGRTPTDILLNPSDATSRPYQAGSSSMIESGRRDGAGYSAGFSAGNQIGTYRQPDGKVLQVTASPLTGVRATEFGASGPGRNAYQTTGGDGTTFSTPGEASGTPGAPGSPADPAAGGASSFMVNPADRQAYQGGDTPRQPTSFEPNMDNRVETRITPERPSARPMTLDERIAVLEARRLGAEGTTHTVPGQDAYMQWVKQESDRRTLAGGGRIATDTTDAGNQLIKTETPTTTTARMAEYNAALNTFQTVDPLSAALSAIGTPPGSPGSATGTTPGTTSTTAGGTTPGIVDPIGSYDFIGQGEVKQPDAKTAAEDMAAMREAMLRARAVTPAVTVETQPRTGATATTTTTPKPETNFSTTTQPAVPDATRALARPLDQQDPKRLEQMEKLIAEAEGDLRAGRYFDADGRFRFVVAVYPNELRGRAGMIHAQLGAGYVRSAGANLRTLLEEYPDQVAMKHQRTFLPQGARLAEVTNLLKDVINDGKNGQAAILLAYLGYQTSDKELVQYGLDRAQEYQPDDAMIAVLRRAWQNQGE